MNPSVIDFMLERRSILIKNMTEPGPCETELNTLLEIAARVPDHRKLEPWRFLVIQGSARKRLSEQLATVKSQQMDLEPEQLAAEKTCFARAPLVIAVVAAPIEHKTPKNEQILSAGAVCQHINIAAAAMGYASQWVTGWSCENKQAQQTLGLTDNEFIAGYLYIGSCDEKPAERKRPDLSEKVTWFND